MQALFIIFSMWMEPIYDFTKTKLKLKSSMWKFVQVVRTFILVTFIKVLPEAGGLKAGLGLWKRIFTNSLGIRMMRNAMTRNPTAINGV